MFDSSKQFQFLPVPLEPLDRAKFPEGCEAIPVLLTILSQATEMQSSLGYQCQLDSVFLSHVSIHRLSNCPRFPHFCSTWKLALSCGQTVTTVTVRESVQWYSLPLSMSWLSRMSCLNLTSREASCWTYLLLHGRNWTFPDHKTDFNTTVSLCSEICNHTHRFQRSV